MPNPLLKVFFLSFFLQMAMSMYYNVQYTIQETTCPRTTEAVTAEKCPLMECEFAVSHEKMLFRILYLEQMDCFF